MGAYFGGCSAAIWMDRKHKLRGCLGQGRKMFGKLRPMLCCPRIPEEERIKTFYNTVASSVLWCSGCWIPSTKTQQLISIWETSWLRCMLGGRKAQDVPWVDWFRTTKTLCAGVKMQVEPSVSVAQSVGGCVWMGGTRGRLLPSWACCNSENLTHTSLNGPMIWKVLQRNVWNDIVSWQRRRLNNSTKYLLHELMITNSKKKNCDLLKNCQEFALKLS